MNPEEDQGKPVPAGPAEQPETLDDAPGSGEDVAVQPAFSAGLDDLESPAADAEPPETPPTVLDDVGPVVLTELPPVSTEEADAAGADELSAGAAPASAAPAASAPPEPWEPNHSARGIAVELKRVEAEIRTLLENCDNKRKRKYEGTRRWLELEEDIIAMRYSGPADEATLSKVRALVARRMHLFQQLNFSVATRHRWNT